MAYPTTTEHHKLYPVTSIMSSPYACDPTGVLDIAPAIELIKANQSNIGTILVPKGTFLVSTNLTIPATMVLQFESGGSFSTAIDVTLAVNGTIRAPTEQIFSGAGTVNISGTTNPTILGKWTGGSGFYFPAMTVAGFVKNSASGVISGGQSLIAADIPSGIDQSKLSAGIDATKIADGSVTNTEFQYINTVTSNIQTQINDIVAGGLPAVYYALILDQKAAGTNGGTSTASTWITRDLNTEVIDTNNIVTIASNQFTLQTGTYRIHASVPGFSCYGHKAKLYNVTSAADVLQGTSEYAGVGFYSTNRSIIAGQFAIVGAEVFEIRHWTTTTTVTYGFGYAVNIATYSEIYTKVEIWKVA